MGWLRVSAISPRLRRCRKAAAIVGLLEDERLPISRAVNGSSLLSQARRSTFQTSKNFAEGAVQCGVCGWDLSRVVDVRSERAWFSNSARSSTFELAQTPSFVRATSETKGATFL